MNRRFWKTTWQRRGDILQWDLAVAILLGILIALAAPRPLLASRFVEILVAEAGIAAGLLGLVLAGLSLTVALMNADLLAWMETQGRGLYDDIWPFSVAAFAAATTTALCVTLIALVPRGDTLWLRVGLGLTTATFVWTLFAVLALIDLVVSYGQVRTEHWRATRRADSGPDDPPP